MGVGQKRPAKGQTSLKGGDRKRRKASLGSRTLIPTLGGRCNAVIRILYLHTNMMSVHAAPRSAAAVAALMPLARTAYVACAASSVCGDDSSLLAPDRRFVAVLSAIRYEPFARLITC